MITIGLAVILTAAVSGCASSSEGSGYEVSAGAGVPPAVAGEHMLYCPDRGLSECHRQARQICGDLGYRQVRAPGSTMTSEKGGSGDLRNQQPLGTTSRRTISQTEMTVRCKKPKKEAE
jgi:hypothetical protein